MVPPIAVDGSLVSIRKFKKEKLGIDDLAKFGAFTEEMAAYLQAAVATRLNIIVSGGTGSGKTTTLNALSSFIDNSERILTIEDTAELQLQQTHVGRMESRPANVEGKGAVSQRDCLRNALRMRPDRIIVGETRGEEVIDMLQAMNTGHDGSMTTIHANSARDGVSRLENMIAMAGIEMPIKAVRVADRQRRQPHRPGRAPAGRLAPHDLDHRDHRHGGRRDLDAGDLPLRAPGHGAQRQDHRPLQRDRGALALFRTVPAVGLRPARRHLRTHRLRNAAMQISTAPFIYGLIFFGVLILVEGIYLTVFGKSISLNSRVNRRLALLEKGEGREKVLEQLRKEMSQHMAAKGIPLYSMLAAKAQKANIAFSPRQLVMIMFGLSAFAYIGLTIGTQASTPVRAAVAVAMGFGGVYMWVANKAKKRLALIEEQLPDAVELMVRSLRVGHPFSAAIGIVAKEVPDPLGTEFGMIADEAAYGRDVAESLKDLAERMDMQDLRFLAVAVTIQQQSGGNLAEILDGLAKVIRARFKLFRRVKAITAEAKWSGMFLSAFPIGALIMINVIQPHYYDDVKKTAYFIPACLVVGVFLTVNVIFMKIMVNIKV